MDLINYLERLKTGNLSPIAFDRLFQYKTLRRVHSSENLGLIHKKISSHASDFSLLDNKLLVAHKNHVVSLYDVKRPIRSGFQCLKTWNNNIRSGLECINWNPEREFFTYSANNNLLFCVDVENMEEIDQICIDGAKKIFQHKPSPHNPEMVAVASPLPKVGLVDLRSGNLTYTAPFHPNGVLSVSWCGLSENCLATANENGVLFWDIRRFQKPLYVDGDNSDTIAVLPNFEIVLNSDQLILLNPDRTITVWDAYKLQKVSHAGILDLPFDRRIRYKFALSGTSEPGLLFMPENQCIVVYEFSTMDIVCVWRLGHVMPVQTLCFNNYGYQLYSSSLDGTLAWVPKPLIRDHCWSN